MIKYVLKKEGNYYVGGMVIWSCFDIRAIHFLTIEEAEKAKNLLHEPDKITIEKGEL